MKIGIRIDNFGEDSESSVPRPYTEIREIAHVAEAGGLDSIWLSEHLLYRFDPKVTIEPWECWTMLTVLAEMTNRVELGTLVLCNPFRNPALLAKMAHILDEISSGRLILGLGVGWHQPEFEAFGYPFNRRADRLEEALQILNPLRKGKSVNFIGKHYQARNCLITPLGPRQEGIPLMLGASGPRMLRLTARYADQWNTGWFGDPQEFLEPLGRIRNACLEVGRDANTLDVTVSASVAFPVLGKTNPFAKKPLFVSAEDLAKAFQQYAEFGNKHLIIQYAPVSLHAQEIRFLGSMI